MGFVGNFTKQQISLECVEKGFLSSRFPDTPSSILLVTRTESVCSERSAEPSRRDFPSRLLRSGKGGPQIEISAGFFIFRKSIYIRLRKGNTTNSRIFSFNDRFFH